MPTRRATLCAEAGDGSADAVRLHAWLDRWQGRLVSCSENKGCGCCVDLFDMEAPQEALDELPAHMLAVSEWSGGLAPAPAGRFGKIRRMCGHGAGSDASGR